MLLIGDIFSFIMSACFAYAVCKLHFTAIRAFYHAGHSKFIMSAAFSFSSFRSLSERYSHLSHLLKRKGCEAAWH